MADVKWIKIVTDVFSNRKIKQIEAMPDADTVLVIWFKLLCLAGNINDGGLITITKDVPYTDEMLSNEFRRPLGTIRLALATFERFGMIEIIDNILCVSNWEKYQNIDSLEKIREQTNKRVTEYRARQKQLVDSSNVTCNVTVTQCNATELDIDKDIDKSLMSKTDVSDVKELKSFPKESKPYRAAAYLNKRICENYPQKPTAAEKTLQQWAGDMDKLNRIDKQSFKDISDVLIYSQDDSFWRANVLSGSKFRKQYFTILARYTEGIKSDKSDER